VGQVQAVWAGKLMGKRQRRRLSANRLRRGREAVLAAMRAPEPPAAVKPDCTLCGKPMDRRGELPWHRPCGLENGVEF